MTTIRIDLPEPMARTAMEAGLLEPKALEALIGDALVRRRRMGDLSQVAAQVSPGEKEPGEGEVRRIVQGEIDRYRDERREPREDRR